MTDAEIMAEKQIADQVREAARNYNQAVLRAWTAGLYVDLRTRKMERMDRPRSVEQISVSIMKVVT